MPSDHRDNRDQQAAGSGGADGGRSPRSNAKATEATERGRPVHVIFRGGRLEGFLNPRKVETRTGDFVIVEAERGVDLGCVVTCEGHELKRRKNQPPRPLQRHATSEEIARLETLVKEDHGALEICRSRAAHFDLDMKVIDAETQFDGNRVTFYFTAEHRVDFRELVRDLASIFRTRIELRQVGARDAARRCDGMGPCGRQLCCTSFLREFEPVTLKMAKEQSLSLNPTKISGACGRLMCCLTYECEAYKAAVRAAPRVGTHWQLRQRAWVVSGLDLGNHRIFLVDAEEESLAVDLDEFRLGATSEQSPLGEDCRETSGEPAGDPDRS